jgi:hypothetical protein
MTPIWSLSWSILLHKGESHTSVMCTYLLVTFVISNFNQTLLYVRLEDFTLGDSRVLKGKRGVVHYCSWDYDVI